MGELEASFQCVSADDTRTDEISIMLSELNPDAMLADGLEDALLGIAFRMNLDPIAAYDREACISALMRSGIPSHEGTVEFFEYNTLGAWVGDGTPLFVDVGEPHSESRLSKRIDKKLKMRDATLARLEEERGSVEKIMRFLWLYIRSVSGTADEADRMAKLESTIEDLALGVARAPQGSNAPVDAS